jgi:hypothetical protein
VDAPLHFLFAMFLIFSTFSTIFGTISSSSSLASSDDIVGVLPPRPLRDTPEVMSL